MGYQLESPPIIEVLFRHVAGDDGENIERKVGELVNFTHLAGVAFSISKRMFALLLTLMPTCLFHSGLHGCVLGINMAKFLTLFRHFLEFSLENALFAFHDDGHSGNLARSLAFCRLCYFFYSLDRGLTDVISRF